MARPWRPRAAAGAVVRDLRGRAGGPTVLSFAAGDVVVVSGLPGGGKSTLIARAAPAGGSIDSQDVRERWERSMPAWLPYAVYRPAVRVAHYWGLWRALASGAPLVVHDCGTQAWVRAVLARAARRRGRSLHLLLLDASPAEALAGQAARGRGVSAYAFARHRRAAARLIRAAESGHLPPGCTTAVLLDRPSATSLQGITFHP
ncbi:ABC transporter ATP-binding protein [Streptomyces sp. WAC06614]|uniref:ATP-binding cassette domain-containing protein n=1 Tax=Streptomyces sp. WAC06614 TaxID=2487416 RepID=UPI000F7A2DF6|nr:ABC transporter ATP-binding protein [Streptomyces sp. WAC06614]RSS84215.1 ATP-binding protein [Streptomyces sp. WAC06614]